MNRAAAVAQPAIDRRAPWLALVCIVAWAGAAFLARYWGIWRSLGGAAVLLGITAVIFERSSLRVLFRISVRNLVAGLLAGGVMAAFTYLLYPPLTRLVPWFVTDTTRLYGAFRVASLLVASLSLIPVVVGEELVWRGIVQSFFLQRRTALTGVVFAATLYALAHAPLESPVLVFVAFACGIYWGLLRQWSGSLTVPLVAHLVWDLLIMLYYPLDGR